MKWYLPAIAWAIFILIICTLPGGSVPSFNLISFDKFGHAGVYFIFYGLAYWGFSKNFTLPSTKNALFIILLVVASFGVLIECIQGAFFKDRLFDVLDILANIIGSIIALAAILFIKNIKR